MKKLLVIDNYDSFTYNLVHAIEQILGYAISVKRNDELDFEDVATFDYLILSPGPGIPDEAGMLKEVIKEFAGTKKILGVCLGHQAIAEVFGAQLENMSEVFHGIQTQILCSDTNCPIFAGLGQEFAGGRYHSWVIEKNSLPSEFIVTCRDEQGEIMGIQHKNLDIFGVQFHPESVLTPEGDSILRNFLNLN